MNDLIAVADVENGILKSVVLEGKTFKTVFADVDEWFSGCDDELELIEKLSKWATKRGFLIDGDNCLICQYQDGTLFLTTSIRKD